jgi:TetR/AcrR family transcriptional regulator
MTEERPASRRQQILEALALDLEQRPGDRVTTARLAEVVGVSEGALYRHFPSKAKMFEALIEFSEETVFALVGRVLSEEGQARARCHRIVSVLLTFAERNPGISRVLLGDALVGEHERLRTRAGQFFNRVETQLKQVLREGEQRDELIERTAVSAKANMIMAIAEGRMSQFVRSRFQRRPTQDWATQWQLLSDSVFKR